MRGSHRISTAPTSEPITLAEAKEHLVVDFTDDDTLITSMIAAARNYCEEYTNRAFMPQTVTQVTDCFPPVDAFRNPHGSIRLYRSPAASLTSITYFDADNEEQTLTVSGSSAEVILDKVAQPATVSPHGVNLPDGWPSTYHRPDAVTLVYVCGWASAGDVPPAIKAAILLMVGEMYERRENFVKKLPTAVEHLLAPWVVREH